MASMADSLILLLDLEKKQPGVKKYNTIVGNIQGNVIELVKIRLMHTKLSEETEGLYYNQNQ